VKDGVDLIFLGLLMAVLLPICLTDIRERRIPDLLNGAVALLGLGHGVARDPGAAVLIRTFIHVGCAAVMVIGTTALMGRMAKDARVGRGDLKFLIAASFWVGVDGVVLVLVLACLIYIGVTLAAAPWRGLDIRKTQPFAPMLAVSMLAVVIALSAHTNG